MKRATRWLLLLGLIIGGMVPLGEIAHAQTGTTVTIQCSQYLRAEPSEESDRVGLMNPGETHTAIGRYGGWLYVQIDPSLQGWTYYGDCVVLNGDFQALPLLDPDQVQPPTYTGPPSATVLCTQYLRRAPDTAAEVLLIMSGADSPLSIGGRTADNNWMLVTTATGQTGWTAYTDCLQIEGRFLEAPVVDLGDEYSGPPVLSVLCAQYVRAQPDLEAARVAIMQPTDLPWTINGRDETGSWLWVTNADGGFTGWTAIGECVNILGSFENIPVYSDTTPAYTGPPVATLSCTQNLRGFPSMEGRQVAVLDVSAGILNVIGRTEALDWAYVRTDNGLQGWLAVGSGCLNIQGALIEAPIVEAPGYTGPPIVQISCQQYLRAMPSAGAEQLAVINPADGPLNVSGRDETGAWVYVQLPSGVAGWTANAACAVVQGDVMSAPVVLAGAAPAAVDAAGAPTASIACSQYLRTAPDTTAPRLAIMQPADGVYDVTGRTESGAWLYLSQPGGFAGWAAWGDCLTVQGDVFSLPVRDSGGYTGPAIANVLCEQYLRAFPDGTSETVAVMGLGATYNVVGRTADGAWVYLTSEDGFEGWAAWGDCLNVQGDVYGVPVMTPTYEGPPVAVVSCSQYLRALPDNTSRSLAVINGTEGTLYITGRTSDSRWMQITMENGMVGWAATGICLTARGDFYSAPVVDPIGAYDGPPLAVVNCEQFLRALPDANAQELMVLTGLEGTLNITGRTADNGWMQITLEDGTAGWSATGACLGVQGELNDAPVFVFTPGAEYSGPAIATLACTQYLRERPDAESEELDILRPEDGILSLLARDESFDWLYVRQPDGQEGWTAYAECLNIQGDVTALPIQDAPTYSGPPVADIVCDVNLRRTPTAGGTVLSVLTAETGLFNVIGRDADTDWLLLEHGSGAVGWVAVSDCVETQGDVFPAPVPSDTVEMGLWTVLQASGVCGGQASQLIAAYNRTGPLGPVSVQCTTGEQALQALTQFNVEIAIVENGGCAGFQEVPLSGGQSLCHRFMRTTQVDDVMDYMRGR